MRRGAHPALLAAIALAGCGGSDGEVPPPGPAPERWFEEAAAPSGLDFVHVRSHVQRFWLPEIMAGGVGFLDYDGDGRLDVYCVQAGDVIGDRADQEESRLYRNRGDGTFEDVTAKAGVGNRGYGQGCTAGDYDGDGDADLYVTNLGPNVLYRNEGNGTFVDVTAESGTGDPGWSTACAFLDHDADGDLDLFVANYIVWSPEIEIACRSPQGEPDYCSPKNYHLPAQSTLYRNEGNGKFTNVTHGAGIDASRGYGMGIAAADFDGDGDLDVYVSNDSVPNDLWINDGRGRFENKALILGCAVNASGASESSMGVHAADPDRDGDWDLYLTHITGEKNTYYRNTQGKFADRTGATGLHWPSLPYTGFGAGFQDFDHDGRLDLFVANGRVELLRPIHREDDPYAEPNQVFRGHDGDRFEEIDAGIKDLVGTSRGAAFGDYDDDGDVDVLYSDSSAPVKLLRNVSPKKGGWLGLRLLGPRGSDALGAAVKIETEAGPQHRICQTSYSYLAANDPRVHFGLGSASGASSVVVTWPSGAREEFGALAGGAYHVLREGSGKAAR